MGQNSSFVYAMNVSRRQFLSATAAGAAAWSIPMPAAFAQADELDAGQKAADKLASPLSVGSGDDLQHAMDRQSTMGGGVVRLGQAEDITCVVRQVPVAGETSIHALLVPKGVELDLNGSTLLLDLRSNS